MTIKRNIVWIASFPKSGNTWTRIFLANYLAPKGKKVSINALYQFTTADIRQDWYDKANGGPFRGTAPEHSLRLRRKVQHLISASSPASRLVKTHTQMRKLGDIDLIAPEVTAAAIYVMRNPFDVAPSFARHTGVDIDAAIARMVDPNNMMGSDSMIVEWLGRWDDHVEGWLGVPGLPRHIMRFEDMLADSETAFRGLVQFLQLPPSDGQLRRALRASSFETLQTVEAREGFRERPRSAGRFFHSGKAGGWRDSLTPAQVGRLREAFLPALERYYPELLAETAAVAG